MQISVGGYQERHLTETLIRKSSVKEAFVKGVIGCITKGGAEMVKLQVALDLLDLSKAILVAEKATKAGAHILEAGTPLIKSEGIKVLDALAEFGLPINADLKTMDTGYLEVELAAVHGADIVSVLAAADDATIEGAIEAGKDYDVEIMADMINSFSVDQIRRLKKLGVDYSLVHVGIDQQSRGEDPIEVLKGVSNLGVKLAVAGGLNKDNITKLPPATSIAIVGGAITRAKDPYLATKEILGVLRLARRGFDGDFS